jgi:hypothetical protein
MGGNVFKNKQGQAATQRINQTDVKPTLAWLEQLTDLDLQNNTLGSTGLKPTSGDMDVAVDSAQISPAQLAAELAQWCASHRLDPKDYVKNAGNQIHFKTPIAGNTQKGYVQTDFMFMNNLDIGKFFMSAPGNSNYSGRDRHIVFNSMAKPLGYKIVPREGLLSRADNSVIATDPDKIAKLLLNPLATRDDLYSVESILQALQNDPKRDAKLADARAFFCQGRYSIQRKSRRI